MAFSDEDADVIFKAARQHMNTCKFFPTIADIRGNINKARLIFDTPKVEPPKLDIRKKLCSGSSICPYFESDLCQGTESEQATCIL